MEKTTTAAVTVILAAVLVIFFLHPASVGAGGVQAVKTPSGPPGNRSGTVSANQESGISQTFSLGANNGQYVPSEIRVKQGTKVRIEGDPATLVGCMNTVNIDGYGISKQITSGNNIIEFTADQTGVFPIHCNMGMGNGRLVVENS